jgi:hypothetical protein
VHKKAEFSKLVKCYKKSLCPLQVHRESHPWNTQKAKNDRAKERAAAAAALTSFQPQLSASGPSLPILSLETPGQRMNALNSVFLRRRELARSQCHACSISRSRSPNHGHGSSSAPADTYAPLYEPLKFEDVAPLPAECPGLLLDCAHCQGPWPISPPARRRDQVCTLPSCV